jgi:murein DD-endopeptidase MepM/ murein hydrolase activator NlpD
MKKLLRKILLELEIPNPVYGATNSKRIDSKYGMRRHPKTGKNQMHSGIDIPVPCGTELKAPDNGTVMEAGFLDDACGGRIKINHDGYSTRYCHLQTINVEKGERIFKGEKIGITGGEEGMRGAGSTTGCHLHMEVQSPIGTQVDPENHVELGLAPKPTSSDTIGKGSTGNPIKTLKCFLKNTKYRTKLDDEKDTNEIGPKTEDAIKELQEDLGVPVNGKITAEMIPLIKDKIQDMNPATKKLIQKCYSSS